jgi:hypothetical protein
MTSFFNYLFAGKWQRTRVPYPYSKLNRVLEYCTRVLITNKLVNGDLTQFLQYILNGPTFKSKFGIEVVLAEDRTDRTLFLLEKEAIKDNRKLLDVPSTMFPNPSSRSP